jgi:hypothetical protein
MTSEIENGDQDRRVCQWRSQADALREFASFSGKTESAAHIKPLHWYVACRLVVEGGFHPDDIVPRPPFAATKHRGEWTLSYDPSLAAGGERTVLGGLKTKNVDVVVTKEGLGPVLAISCKGVTKAFRNLTNRMEETIGECTNLHITYPALVLGYLVAIRANRLAEEAISRTASEVANPAAQLAANDIAIQKGGEPVENIIKFHAALREMTGRRGIRNDISRYEAIALAMIDMIAPNLGALLPNFPFPDSSLRLEQFFDTLYLRYDERYVYSAPSLKTVTTRLQWTRFSTAFDVIKGIPGLDYDPRLAGEGC